MKRVLCMLLVLLLLPLSALADVLTEIETYYGSMIHETGGKSLPEKHETVKKDEGKTQIIYRFSETFVLIYTFDSNGTITAFSAGCSSEDDYIEFLSVCNAGLFSVLRDDYNLDVLGDFVFQFISIRNGKEASSKFSFAGNYAYSVERLDEKRIVLIAVKVE